MCWSAEASLSTYLAAMTMAAITRGTTEKIWWLMFTFSQMQLAEFFMWRDMPNNQFGSMLGALSLALQPVASIYMIENIQLRNTLWGLYALILSTVLMRNPVFRAEVGGNGHLKWLFIDGLTSPGAILWLVFLLAPFVISKSYKSLAFGLVTLAASIYFYEKYGTAGTMWCWIVVLAWLFLLLKHLTSVHEK